MTYAEKRIAEVMAETGNKKFAAFQAGVSPTSGAVERALSRPEVVELMERTRREMVAALYTRALPAAVNCLVEILEDPKAPAGARGSAAKTVLDNTIGKQDENHQKEPHEMTPEEIAARIAQLEHVAAANAKTVESAQPVPNDGDMFS